METDVQAEILHIGNLDPSVEHLFTALAEDVAAMTLEVCGAQPQFTRLAVTREQVAEMNLPTAPVKATDRRQFMGGETVQAEAIDPDTLVQILRGTIEERRDIDIGERLLAREAEMRATLMVKLEGAQ